jgi:hypothetical protein
MSNQKLLDYINDCQKQGFSTDKIKETLSSAGWLEEDMKQAFDNINKKNNKNIKEGEDKGSIIKQGKAEDNLEKKTMKKRFSLNKYKLIIIVVIFLLLFSGVFLVFSRFQQSNNFEKNLSRSFNALAELQTFSLESAMRLDIDFSQSENKFISNILDKNNGYILFNINGEIDLNQENAVSKIFLGLYTDLFEEDITVLIDTKSINDKFYLRLKNLPKAIDFLVDEEIIKKWLEFEINELEASDFKETYNQEIINDILEIAFDNLNLTDLIVILDEDELVFNHHNTYYYHFTFNKEAMPDFIINTYRDIYFNFEESRDKFNLDEEMTENDWHELRQEVVDGLDDFNFYTFKIWIDKESYLPHKISTFIEFNSKNLGFDLNLEAEYIFTSFNKKMNIEPPEDTISFDEMLELLSLNQVGPHEFDNENMVDFSHSLYRDSRRVSDVKQIQTALELYYHSANQYPSSLETAIIYDNMIFLDPVPIAPVPADCENNDYIYTAYVDEFGLYKHYCIRYCISNDLDHILAGDPIYATKNSINVGSTCPFDF